MPSLTLDCIVSLLRCVRLAPSIPPQREPFTTTYPSLITGPGLFIVIFVIFQCTFFSCNPNAVWSWTKGNFRKKVVIFHLFICFDGDDGLTEVSSNFHRYELSSQLKRERKSWWITSTWRISIMEIENLGFCAQSSLCPNEYICFQEAGSCW